MRRKKNEVVPETVDEGLSPEKLGGYLEKTECLLYTHLWKAIEDENWNKAREIECHMKTMGII